MALETHPKGPEGVYEDNLPWVMGVEVEIRKQKDTMMMRVAWIKVEVRTEKKVRFFFILKKKRYEDQLSSKLEQQPFPGNGASKLVGYFNDCEINPQAHGYHRSFHP